MEFVSLGFGFAWDLSPLFSLRFVSLRMGISIPPLSHHCILEAHNLTVFRGPKLERSFASEWIVPQVLPISDLDDTLDIDFLFLTLYFILFYFGCIGFSLLCGLSLVAASRGYSSLHCLGFSLLWLLLLWSMGSRRMASVVALMGLVAPRHVGSSRPRDRTHVPCTGRRISTTAPPEKAWI